MPVLGYITLVLLAVVVVAGSVDDRDDPPRWWQVMFLMAYGMAVALAVCVALGAG